MINAFVLCSLFFCVQVVVALEVVPDREWRTAPNVVSFQPFSETSSPVLIDRAKTKVQLVNLNKFINSWFLLEVGSAVYNLENPFPFDQSLSLNAEGQMVLTNKMNQSVTCDLLSGALAKAGSDPYAGLCGDRLYLRNHTNGRKDIISWGTTMLRDYLGESGDNVVNFVKENIYEGQFFEAGIEKLDQREQSIDEGGPRPARVGKKIRIQNSGLGLVLEDDVAGGMEIGQWYKSKNYDGVYASVMKAKFVDPQILKTYRERVNNFGLEDGGEGDALVDSVAIDLSKYKFGWNNGTEHPGVGWSPRATNAHVLPGPDGFDSLAPLNNPGVVNPYEASRTIAVLMGGFQRRHSAFKAGPLTGINRSHHYGFMEKGVLMSTIVPNLATFIIFADGTIELKTWTVADNARLSQMRDIRQNGVPLIETDAVTGEGIPSPLVNKGVLGNWSGSGGEPSELKTPRTSACIVEENERRFLVVSYFSTHTPSSMARVLQSYGCKYAIHLDMNHPKFAYTAFFKSTADGDFKIEHLSNAMVDDVILNGKRAPRALLTPTYKDFFYVIKK